MFFLERLDLRLDELELLLAHEHMVLGREEDESNDEGDDYDSPSEHMSRKKREQCYEKIVYRFIKYS